ncbi:MAG: heavy-metal-associated domain-containing protein [archaeon]
METTIYCPDIECDSCVKLIQRRFKGLSGINNFEVKKDRMNVDYDKTIITEQNIISAIKTAGFRASTNPFTRKSVKERVRHLKENPQHYRLELQAMQYALVSFLVLTAIEAVAYLGFLNGIPGFLARYGWWLFYLNVTVATVGAAMWHVASYKAEMTCMVGMMIGMTIGMQAGMMLGAVVGATNGFFVGSMAGMLVGVIVGLITGRCCGVMGLMEGMMAGLMGGTMGPMISVMMYSDHLLVFMPFYIIINVLILAGLVYMMLEEVGEGEQVTRTPADITTFLAACVFVTGVMVAIMVYGPKSPFLA